MQLLHDPIERGVNYVDTAWFYHASNFGQPGQSEPFVGRAPSGGWRERVNLATKLPQQLVRTREDMDRFLAQQLERLQTDHIDFYLVHGLNGEAWDRMRGLGMRKFLDGAAADPWLTGWVRIEGKPDACTECGQCEEMCPQGLPIRELLKETTRTFGG